MKLEARNSSQKSFYGKSTLVTENGVTFLKSYGTIVAIKMSATIEVLGYFSKTTAIHINEFLMQNGIKKLVKKELEQKPTFNI